MEMMVTVLVEIVVVFEVVGRVVAVVYKRYL